MTASRGSRPEHAGAEPPERSVVAAARVVGLRTPLSRIRLVADRLRDPAGAGLAQQASSLDDAVDAVDRGIQEILAVLVPPRALGRSVEVGDFLATLRGRTAPSLRARGIEWLEEGGEAPGIEAPASLIHEAAVALVRDAAAAGDAGSQFRLRGVTAGPESWGLELSVEPPLACAEEEPFDVTAEWALRQGATLEVHAAGATVWLGGAEPNPAFRGGGEGACPAS